ncbi:MAG: beta-galactosidase [Bacteroidetes bacterium GWE2_42_24]|nr:MAG: beta-galactosidase [Bacteroidetes bacterium GWE2_42_24]OFY28956.1 MAG: beta-galactosidase [Bacteroidetes bacterium GWF2_43_11]
MKKSILNLCLLLSAITIQAQPWQPAGDKIKTSWADKVDPASPLPEYPRPQMVRDQWLNLNGLWNYAILPAGNAIPATFDGKILVPFAIESSLSGVGKNVGIGNELWYSRQFDVPEAWKKQQILLQLGAVDWKADIWINGVQVGGHRGGYTPFSFDITPFLKPGAMQEIVVRVWDPSNQGFQPRGKQVTRPGGIWYTSVTGIWQTVWLEPVAPAYIGKVASAPNIDGNTVTVKTFSSEDTKDAFVEVRVMDGGKLISHGRGIPGNEVLLAVPQAKLWSPESPFLYDLEVDLIVKGKVTDRVKSYFGMRKIATHRDANGIVRLQLNNHDYFQFGPLDQGWWPDGLYTAPTDEALRFDIVKTKEYGFNLIRKHVKVEPARWYYHCDREGMLVWQDMPSGDDGPDWQPGIYFNGTEVNRSPQSEENFRREWKEIIDLLISDPCIVAWVPFNESWGQFKTPEIVQWTQSYDPSRLVNPASGGNHYPVGDMLDVHHYPDPELSLLDGSRACVLGEYGGIGLAIENHLWVKDRNWGYVQYKTSEEATDTYVKYAEKLKNLIRSGFTAAIYTQTTDVEIEVNGLMTYDRKVMKLDMDRLRKVNREICESLTKENGN